MQNGKTAFWLMQEELLRRRLAAAEAELQSLSKNKVFFPTVKVRTIDGFQVGLTLQYPFAAELPHNCRD